MIASRRSVLRSIGAAALGAAFTPRAAIAAEGRLSIVATTGMIADTARDHEIGRAHV